MPPSYSGNILVVVGQVALLVTKWYFPAIQETKLGNILPICDLDIREVTLVHWLVLVYSRECWRALEIAGEHWRLSESTGDCRRALESAIMKRVILRRREHDCEELNHEEPHYWRQLYRFTTRSSPTGPESTTRQPKVQLDWTLPICSRNMREAFRFILTKVLFHPISLVYQVVIIRSREGPIAEESPIVESCVVESLTTVGGPTTERSNS